jgi:hypothetical protein
MTQLVKAKTEAALLVEDLRSNQSQSKNQRSSLETQLQRIRKEIQEKEVELMELEPEWEKARQNEMDQRHA